MAMTNVVDLSNEELITAVSDYWRPRDEVTWIKDELLRRLSAGNSQAEKVQINDNGRYAPCGCPGCPNVRYDYGQQQPERSDGRIEAAK